MPGEYGHVVNEQIHPHARGYLLGQSAQIGLGADTGDAVYFIGMTPPGRRFVIDWVQFLYVETADDETSTIAIGHTTSGGTLDVNSICEAKEMAADAAIKTIVAWTAAELAAGVLASSITYPGLAVVPAASAVWATVVAQAGDDLGEGFLFVHGFDWCEL